MDEQNLNQFNESKDELYDEAVKIVREYGKASTSLLQRKLRLGYNRAARLIDQMEENAVIGPAVGAEPRIVYGFDNVEPKTITSVSSSPVMKKPAVKANPTVRRSHVRKKPMVQKKTHSFDWDWFFNPSYCCPNCGSPAFKYVMRSAGREGTVRRYRHPVKRSWFWSSGRSEINIMSRQKTVGYCPDCGYMTEHRRHSPFSICLVILCIIIFIVIAFQKGWIYVY